MATLFLFARKYLSRSRHFQVTIAMVMKITSNPNIQRRLDHNCNGNCIIEAKDEEYRRAEDDEDEMIMMIMIDTIR